ncbi:MAG: hypothetical protein CMO01_08955, partial [Thalassobius sp.]|nr:hypothetical protein [Thalassovita sp.]
IGQDNYQSALREFFKATKISTKHKDSVQLIKNYFNIGLCYDEIGTYDSALLYVDKSIELGKTLNSHKMIEMAYNRKAETLYHLKDYDGAINLYKTVIYDTLSDSNWENSFAYSGLGQVYSALGKYVLANNNAWKGYELAKKLDAKWDIERALRVLANANAAARNYKRAYEYQILLKKYSDELYTEAKDKEINALHLKQKEAENQQLIRDNQIEQQKNSLNRLFITIISMAAISLLIVTLLIYKNSRQKNRLNQLLLEKNKNIATQKEKISHQNQQLVNLNSTKDQLFSVISHDLKSPFASILGSFELIRLGSINAFEKEKLFSELHKKVSTVYTMLNNLLYWANSQQKGIKTVPKEIVLADVVKEILSVYEFLAEEKQIQIKHVINADNRVLADVDHVKIVVQNILGNAIKFTPKYGVVNIFYSDEEEYYAVHVKDSGIGIPENKLKKIFKESGKGISSMGTNNEKGTGLGLMLVKQFVEGNKGKFEVKSKLNEGTEFTIYFKKVLIAKAHH